MPSVFRVALVLLSAAAPLAVTPSARAAPPQGGPVGSSYGTPAEDAARQLALRNQNADQRLGGLLGAPSGELAPGGPGRPAGPQPGGSLAALAPDWTPGPQPLPWLTVPIHAYLCKDYDGSQPVAVTPAQIAAWVAKANDVWESAHVRFTFDPSVGSGDWEWLASSLMNELSGEGHPQWAQQVVIGNTLAAGHPGEATVFFRHGPDAAATGGGFSWTSFDFVAMPGWGTGVCGTQNIGLLGHELGHYLGLSHTFPDVFLSQAAAQTYFVNGGKDKNVFEADGRDETWPDPYVETWTYQCDPATTTITLSGTTFTLPKDNTMGYYYPDVLVTPGQARAARQTWQARWGSATQAQVLGGAGLVEGEGLVPNVTGGWTTTQVMGSFHGRWSGGTQLLWLDGAVGNTLSAIFWNVTAGDYAVYAGLTAAPDFGTVRHRVNGNLGPYAENLYASVVTHTGPAYLGTFHLGAGFNTLQVEVVGTDPRANPPRYGYGLDYVALGTPPAAATETVRQGFPPNAVAFLPGATSGPVVGAVWDPWVDHGSFQPGSIWDLMAVTGGGSNVWIGFQGTLLCDLGSLVQWVGKGPAAHYGVPIPLDAAFVGVAITTQVGSILPSGDFKLTNALDLSIGTY